MYRIDFDSIAWTSPMPHVREKVVERDGRRLRLVEFGKEFAEEGWCTRGHIGMVLSGSVEITFADHKETFNQGDGVFIPDGENSKHNAKVLSDVVVLMFVEEG